MPIQDIALKISRERWTIETSGERGPLKSVLAAWHDEDEDECLVIIITIAQSVGVKIRWIYSWQICKNIPPMPKICFLCMTGNHLMVRGHVGKSQEYRVQLHSHYSQFHSEREWLYCSGSIYKVNTYFLINRNHWTMFKNNKKRCKHKCKKWTNKYYNSLSIR